MLAGSNTILTAFGPCRPVFQATLVSARFRLAPQPLTFTVLGLTHGRAHLLPHGFSCSSRRENSQVPRCAPPFCAGCMLVSPHDGGVQQQVLQVRFSAQNFEDPLPNTSFAPAIASPEDRVPVTESLRQITPGGSCLRDPQHSVYRQSIILARSARIARLARQVRLDPPPLFI
jgi:hypothetical protein